MSIIRIDFPNPAPVDITDWEKIIDIAEFNTLGTQNQAWWDFTGNTVKQGVRIMIGGTVYLSSTVTAITGTPSDYVRITPAGATASASYVSSLAGVTWNSVWNHYEDGSGNAYLFDEAKENLASPKTPIGTFAKNAYIDELTTYGQTILARDGGHVEIANNGINIYPEFLQSVAESNDIHASIGKSENGGSLYPFTQGGHLLLQARADFSREIILLGQDGEPGLTFFGDTKNVQIGGALNVDPGAKFLAAVNPGLLPTLTGAVTIVAQNNSAVGNNCYMNAIAGNEGISGYWFGDEQDQNSAQINYNHLLEYMTIFTDNTEAIRIFDDNSVSINSTSNLATLHVDGDMRVTGTDGAVILDANGKRQDMSVADGYGFKNTDVAGYMRFVTANRTNNDASANLVLNVDQSVTVNTTLLVDTIAEKTAAAGVAIDGFTIKDGGFVVSGVVVKMKVLSQPYTSASVIQVTHGVNAANIRGAAIANSNSVTMTGHSTGTTFVTVYLTTANTGTIYVTLFYI